MKNTRSAAVRKISLTGLMAALSYVVFTFLQIPLVLPGGSNISLHLGNAVCVLGGLLLGGFYGGLGGAVGMTIGDLFHPIYFVEAPKTFLLKFCIGLITGLVAHKLGKIARESNRRKVFSWSLAAASAGLIFNIIFAPLAGYYYKLLILGQPAAEVALVWNIVVVTVNAVASLIVSVATYMALQPALKRAGLLT